MEETYWELMIPPILGPLSFLLLFERSERAELFILGHGNMGLVGVSFVGLI